MKLLMHICCANCAIYPVERVRSKGIDLEALWFNPNIHPYKEYEHRLESVKRFSLDTNLTLQVYDNYGLVEFLRNTVYRENERCHYCYNVRLETTAKLAKKMGMDAFTTTLLVSIYQDTGLITTIAEMMSHRYNVEFYLDDFKKGFYEGRKKGRQLGYYQQKYCGCIYSEMQRYSPSSMGQLERTDPVAIAIKGVS